MSLAGDQRAERAGCLALVALEVHRRLPVRLGAGARSHVLCGSTDPSRAVRRPRPRGGNDQINARAGGDQIRAGTGADRAYGSAGNDEVIGGDGNDWLFAGCPNGSCNAGSNVIFGGNGNDVIGADNGKYDDVNCSAGSGDVAYVDSSDDWAGCEYRHIDGN